MDVQRASVIFTLLGGVGARVNGSSCSARTGNPFKGKSPQELEDMFLKKGFDPRGPDPANGKGGYVNPRSNRSFHIDEKNSFGEPPHVDVNRPRNYKRGLPK
jgi:Bacterial toxin 37